MKTFRKSSLWDSILKTEPFKKIDLKTFKNENANTKITQYSYKTHGLLFLKNLIFQMTSTFKHQDLLLLNKIPNRDLGGGESINYKNIILDLDYLLALEETLFLKDTLKTIKSILEIGAGYGRTCHTILSLFPHIQEYSIIDLPQMLKLSNAYLKKTSQPENFKKIQFIPIKEILNKEYDLIINIDSMQEMDCKVVQSYMKYIDDNGKLFYSKNTIGKFDPSLFGWEKSENSELALKSGLLREKINIFCPLQLRKAQENFLTQFLPSQNWSVLKHAVTLPWSHYYQALFSKNV